MTRSSSTLVHVCAPSVLAVPVILTVAAASELILNRAKDIEKTVLKANDGTTAAYKAKIRSLFVNLKDKNNPGLRGSVISGDLAVSQLCVMSTQVSCRSDFFGAVYAVANTAYNAGHGVGGAQTGRRADRTAKFVQHPRRRGARGRDGRFPVRPLQTGAIIPLLLPRMSTC